MANPRTNQGGIILDVRHIIGFRRTEMAGLNAILEPGMLVRHPSQPDWGVGQVQSNIGGRITVNFPDAGKVVIDGARIMLEIVHR